jgi:type IV fimbrial biogenesis protein FimT
MDRRHRHHRGFTLTELLTTLTVAGIGAALVVPSFDTVVSNNRRAAAVNQLVSAMHAARSEAITRNTQITICPSSDAQNCDAADWQDGWIYFADADRDRTVDEGDSVLGAAPAPSRLTITTAEFPDFLAYRPNGRVMADTPADNSGQFTFCDHRSATYARVVIVSSLGEPRLSEKQADGSDPVCGGG